MNNDIIIPSLLDSSGAFYKRQISDMLDQSVRVHAGCFVVTADNRHVASCGYWDRSFRVIAMDTGNSHSGHVEE